MIVLISDTTPSCRRVVRRLKRWADPPRVEGDVQGLVATGD
jgi:hypothetical protein